MNCINLLGRYASFILSTILIIVCQSSGLSQSVAELDKIFNPSTIGINSTTTLTFTITNNSTINPLTGITFTDDLPDGIQIASPSNLSTTCDGVLSAPDYGKLISFSAGTVDPSSSCTISLNVVGTELLDVEGEHVAVRTNTTSELVAFEGNFSGATADLTVLTDRPGFTKAFVPSLIAPGGTSRLIFRIDNTANDVVASQLSFNDDLPSGVVIANPPNLMYDTIGCDITPGGATITAVSGTSSFSYSNGTVGASSDCSMSVEVTAANVGTYENISDELYSFGEVSSGFATAQLRVTDALFLTKSFTNDPVFPGGTVDLEFTIVNFNGDPTVGRDFGGATATGISFSDDLDNVVPGLLYSTTNINGCGGTLSSSDGGKTIDYTGGMLQAGDTCIVEVSLLVPGGINAPPPGNYTNTTTPITANNGNLTGNAATDILSVLPAPEPVNPSPTFTKFFASPSATPNSTIDLTFNIAHSLDNAPNGASLISFSDDLEDFISGAKADIIADPNVCGGTLSGGETSTISFSGGSLAPGEECEFTVGVKIPSGASIGIANNTTTNISSEVDGNTVTGNAAVATLSIAPPPVTSLTLTKEFLDDPVFAGAAVPLKFTLNNVGQSSADDATSIIFEDDLDNFIPGATATIADPNVCGGTLTVGSTVTLSAGSLAFGQSCNFTVTLAVPADAEANTYTNTTTDFVAIIGGNVVSLANASDDLTVSEPRVLTFSKSFSPDFVLPGDQTTLTFLIDNDNDVPATGIGFTDDIAGFLPGAIILSTSGSCGTGTWSASGGELSLVDGDLPADGNCSLSAVIKVPDDVSPNTFGNITSALSATLNNSSVISPAAAASLSIYDVRSTLEKFTNGNIAPGVLNTGDEVEWTYVITNNQPTVLTINSLSDDQEGPITCPVSTLNPGESTTCTQTGTVIAGPYTNIATLSASAGGFTFTLTDQNSYFGSCEPSLSCPGDISVSNDPGDCGAIVNYTVPVDIHACPGFTVSRTVGPPSGAFFPVGTTTVTYELTADIEENEIFNATCSFTVTVVDVTPPTVNLKDSEELWPPNGKYETFNLDDMIASINDNCDGNISVSDANITSGTSDEPENGSGDGNTVDDIVISGDCKSVQVRSERKGNGNGRVYTINLQVFDNSGNPANASYIITVPKSKNGNPAVDDGPVYTETCGSSIQISDTRIIALQYLITPNPAKEEIFFDISSLENSKVTIELYNINGQKFLDKKINKVDDQYSRIDISELMAGTYFIIASQHNQRISASFVKIE